MSKYRGGTEWLRTPTLVSNLGSNVGFPLTKCELWTGGATCVSFHYYI